MKNDNIIYEGKFKRLLSMPEPSIITLEFKDTAATAGGFLKSEISGKGEANNAISACLFRQLEQEGIRTHFIKKLSNATQAVKKVEMIPLIITVRNIASGYVSKNLGVKENTILNSTVIEYRLKSPELNNPLLNDYHIAALEVATLEDMVAIAGGSIKVNSIIKKYFSARGYELADFDIEFGKADGVIVVADELSLDTCRLTDSATGEKLNRDRLRPDLSGAESAYSEIAQKILAEVN